METHTSRIVDTGTPQENRATPFAHKHADAAFWRTGVVDAKVGIDDWQLASSDGREQRVRQDFPSIQRPRQLRSSDRDRAIRPAQPNPSQIMAHDDQLLCHDEVRQEFQRHLIDAAPLTGRP